MRRSMIRLEGDRTVIAALAIHVDEHRCQSCRPISKGVFNASPKRMGQVDIVSRPVVLKPLRHWPITMLTRLTTVASLRLS